MLTAAQKKLLDFIRDELARTGIVPSYAEMTLAMGMKSKSAVYRTIMLIEDRGFIRRIPYRARSIEIVERPPSMTAGQHIGIAQRIVATMPPSKERESAIDALDTAMNIVERL